MVGTGYLFCVGLVLEAAPGDLQLEILARTGDANVGPSGLVISKFENFPPGSNVPVAIDESGFISFAAEVQVNGDPEYGFYRALAPGNLTTLIQTDGLVPGLNTFDSNEPGNRRALQLGSSPRRGFSVNRDGSAHALILRSRFDGDFLYSVSGDVVGSEPVSWPVDISENRNLWDAVSISDGRGTTKQQSAGSSGDMVVSRDGTIFWKLGDAIIRASSRNDVRAVMFKDTPAPGFDEEEGAMLGIPLDFRGVDASNNAYFRAWVTKSSGDIDVLYRHNDADDTLSLLFKSGKTPLPDGAGSEIVATVEGDDIAVLEDGTVFIRGKISGSRTGFWKREPNKEFELLRLISEFPGTETDVGAIGLRSVAVDFADWAVADDHSVFFTADVRFGASGINQEGVWKIDPEDNSIITLARAPLDGSFGDAPGTEATYGRIIQISAIGQGRVAFTADLSDGTEGLFATDINEGVVKIIKVGDELDGSLVQSFHFNTDTAGEDLIRTQGTLGLNKFGEVAFLATLENNSTVLVRASYEGEERARGTKFFWDEGISGFDWHEVEDGKTNWVDVGGIRWDEPPGLISSEVIIPAPHFVEMNRVVPVIGKLEVGGTLDLNAALKVRESTVITGEVNLLNNASLISEGDVSIDGEFNSFKDAVRTITTDPSHTITTKGMITGNETGIWATADNGVTIDNEARVTVSELLAIFADTKSGPINIRNKGDLTSSNGLALRANSDTGAIDIQSPPEGSPGVQLAANGHAIHATTAGDISIRFDGETETVQGSGDAMSILAVTTGGSVDIESSGAFSGTSIGAEAGGIWARGMHDVTVKHTGSMNVNGWGILAESSDGDVMIDGRDIFLSARYGGLEVRAPQGAATIYSAGEMTGGLNPGINAKAAKDIIIESNGPITTIGGVAVVSASQGIVADSTEGSVEVTHTGEISTTHFWSTGVQADAATDVTLKTRGNISTFEGSGIAASSTSGFIDIDHQGTIAATNKGQGIWAQTETGSIIIRSDDPWSSISSTGDASIGSGIEAQAGGSVLVEWVGDITAWGSQANTIYAKSETAGVSVTTKGSVLAAGSSSNGAVLSGPSSLQLNVLSGGITGSDGLGKGVIFIGGTENQILNHGGISAFSFNAISTDTGNDKIENYGTIAGSIDLGVGSNSIENYFGGILTAHADLKLGAGNLFTNRGIIQLGEPGENVRTTNMVGDLFMEPTTTLRMEIADTMIDGTPIVGNLMVEGNVTVDGVLNVHLQEDYDEPKTGDSFTILSATSLAGTFFNVRVFNSPNSQAEVSRQVGVELSYSANEVIGTVSLLNVDDYESWQDIHFTEEEQADESLSGPEANPDGDGLSNGDESLFGGDPNLPDGSPVSFELGDAAASDGIQISATFNVADGITDREWFFETSPDLTTWEEANVSTLSTEDTGDFSQLTVEFDQPVTHDGSTFVRLQSRAINP